MNVLASYFQPFLCPIELHCLRTYCDNSSGKTQMFCSCNIARRGCNCCRRCPLEAFLTCKNLKAKIKETVAFCNYFVAVLLGMRHVHLPSLSLHKGTSAVLVSIDRFSMPRFMSTNVQKSLLPQQS